MRPVFEHQLAFFNHHRIVGILQANSADSALKACEAAIIGGIKIIEVPFGTPGAIRVIAELRRKYGERILVGAGSVTTVEMADRVVKANAQFVTSPHTNAALIEFCCGHNVFAIPGAATPTEILSASTIGVPLVNVFPAGMLGGVAYIQLLQSLTRDIGLRLLVTGGVKAENAKQFLLAGAMALGVGEGLFLSGSVGDENYVGIAENARLLAKLVQGSY